VPTPALTASAPYFDTVILSGMERSGMESKDPHSLEPATGGRILRLAALAQDDSFKGRGDGGRADVGIGPYIHENKVF